MQISVEQTSTLGRKLNVTIPAAEIDNKANDKLNDLAKKAKLPGFRPGKVPFEVIKQRYGDSARREVIADTIQSSYFEALKQEQLKPAGMPNIDPSESKFGEPLQYVASFEIYPEIKLTTLDGVKIEKSTAKLADADVDNMIEKLRKQHANWQEVEREAKKGDQLVIDFDGTIKGEAFQGGSSKDFKFELGAGMMLDDFEDPLSKAKAGDEVKFKVKFPKDYSDEAVAGKKADFVVKVHKVLEAEIPELNDDFLAKIGIKEGGVDKLRQEMRNNMEQQLTQNIDGKLREKILDKLLELNTIELPNALVDEEIKHLQDQAKQQFAQYAKTDVKDLPDLPREEFEDRAKRRVRLGLLLGELIKTKELTVEPEQVKNKIKEMAAGYEKPDEVVSWYYQHKQYLAEIESMLLEQKAMVYLQNQVQLVEKEVSFDELMKQ